MIKFRANQKRTMRKKPIEVWVDLLCWESVLAILFSRKFRVRKIIYFQASKLFTPFLFIFQILIKVDLEQSKNFVMSEEHLGGITAYEILHNRLNSILESVSNQWTLHSKVCNFVKKNGYNLIKVREHLKEQAFYYIYRPIEMGVVSEIRSDKGNRCFVFRRTPFSNILINEFNNDELLFYRNFFSCYFLIINRKDYYYDKVIFNSYYPGCSRMFFGEIIHWFRAFIKAVLCRVFSDHRKILLKDQQTNIGIEQSLNKIRLDERNDIFWMEDSEIDPKSVYFLEHDRLDLVSQKVLSSFGIQRVRVNVHLWFWFEKLFKRNNGEAVTIDVTSDIVSVFRTLWPILLASKISFRCNEGSWIDFQLASYKYRTICWQSIFKELNIKILWAMLDIDRDKLVKAQALENIGGIYTGSHWSKIELFVVLAQKTYDVFFTWGLHFVKNIYNSYPYLGVFIVGYIYDYCFIKQQKRAKSLKDSHSGKFILSYMDEVVSNDIPFSQNMQIMIYNMLISILEKNNHLCLFLKPKKKYGYDKIVEKVPQIKSFIKKGRIKVFFGGTTDTKEVPAMVGMASDLVFGLGIRTAVAECYFAGALVFNADLAGFVHNEFSNKGLNKIVFRDTNSLKEAIQEIIDNGSMGKHFEYKKYYSSLDPFQDGKAYRRIAFVLKELQGLFNEGFSREDAVRRVQERYKDFLYSATKINGETDV